MTAAGLSGRFVQPSDRTHPALFLWVPHYEPLTWPVLAYLKWKTAVPFKRDTTLYGQGRPAQIIPNAWGKRIRN